MRFLLVFNIFTEVIPQKALEDMEIGTKGNGIRNYNNIRYADDIVLIANNIHEIEQLVELVGIHSHSVGMDINTNISRNFSRYKNSNINFERVDKF